MKEALLKSQDVEEIEEDEEDEETLTSKALEEATPELASLDEKQAEFEVKLEVLRHGDSDELLQKRLNVLGRKLEEAEVMGEQKIAEGLRHEVEAIRAGMEGRKKGIEQIEPEIDKIEVERKRIVKELLLSVHPSIKESLVEDLQDSLDRVEREKASLEEVADEYGVCEMLPPSFFRELRIFREGKYRQIRDKLDEYLP